MSKRKFPCPYCERKYKTAGDRDVHAEACILQNLTPEPLLETGSPKQNIVKGSGMEMVGGVNRIARDWVTEALGGAEDCSVREAVMQMVGGAVNQWDLRSVGLDLPKRCPKCGHGSAGIYLDELPNDELPGQWACLMCGWRSGSRPPVPVTPEPGWPHQRRWMNKE